MFALLSNSSFVCKSGESLLVSGKSEKGTAAYSLEAETSAGGKVNPIESILRPEAGQKIAIPKNNKSTFSHKPRHARKAPQNLISKPHKMAGAGLKAR